MSEHAVRVGLLLPQYDCSAEQTLAAARAADAHGLDIWLAGQIFPISSSPEKAAFEPLSMMGAVAATTTVSRLGFMALAAPYLAPLYLAKALITLDHLSAGRLEVGLGAGWREPEFAALGIEFGSAGTRRRQLVTALDNFLALSAGVAAEGGDGEFVLSAPAALQHPHPPLWIGGSGPRMLELVGERADWANFARGISAADFAVAGATVRAAAVARGRGPEQPGLSLTGTFLGAADSDALERRLAARAAARNTTTEAYRQQLIAANVLVGSPVEMASQLAGHVAAGCRAVILWPLDGEHVAAAALLAELRSALAAA